MYALFWQMDAKADKDGDPWGLGGQLCSHNWSISLQYIFHILYIYITINELLYFKIHLKSYYGFLV